MSFQSSLYPEVRRVEPGSVIQKRRDIMRKRLITAARVDPRKDQDWLDLGSVATVEVTSESVASVVGEDGAPRN